VDAVCMKYHTDARVARASRVVALVAVGH
jgi:hypothetical protein